MTISKELLDKLACPKCRGPVDLADGGLSLSCRSCHLAYDVREGIPVMIVELARPLGEGGSPASMETA